MITAAEARSGTALNLTFITRMGDVERRIKSAMSRGSRYVVLESTGDTDDVWRCIHEDLLTLGYKVLTDGSGFYICRW